MNKNCNLEVKSCTMNHIWCIVHGPLLCPQIYCEREQRTKITGINWLKTSIQQEITTRLYTRNKCIKTHLTFSAKSHLCDTIMLMRTGFHITRTDKNRHGPYLAWYIEIKSMSDNSRLTLLLLDVYNINYSVRTKEHRQATSPHTGSYPAHRQASSPQTG